MHTLLLSLALAVVAAVPSASAQSVAGEWNAFVITPGGTREFKVILQVRGDSLSGTLKRASGDVPLSGTIKGDDVTFSYSYIVRARRRGTGLDARDLRPPSRAAGHSARRSSKGVAHKPEWA